MKTSALKDRIDSDKHVKQSVEDICTRLAINSETYQKLEPTDNGFVVTDTENSVEVSKEIHITERWVENPRIRTQLSVWEACSKEGGRGIGVKTTFETGEGNLPSSHYIGQFLYTGNREDPIRFSGQGVYVDCDNRDHCNVTYIGTFQNVLQDGIVYSNGRVIEERHTKTPDII